MADTVVLVSAALTRASRWVPSSTDTLIVFTAVSTSYCLVFLWYQCTPGAAVRSNRSVGSGLRRCIRIAWVGRLQLAGPPLPAIARHLDAMQISGGASSAGRRPGAGGVSSQSRVTDL